MTELLIYLPLLVPVVVANLAERHRLRPSTGGMADRILPYATQATLVAINVGLLGIAFLALLNALATRLMPGTVPQQSLQVNWWYVALASFLTGMVGFAPLVPGVRRWLARWLPIDPESLVHMTALAYAIYQVGLSLGQMALIGGIENLAQAGLALTIWDVVLSEVPLLLFGLLGIGWLVRRDWREMGRRLGFLRPTWKQLLVALGLVILLLGLDYGINLLWQDVNPSSFEVMNRVMESLFGGLATVGGAIVLGLAAGIGEETLFRGAVQPRLGILLTSILFALGHLQYSLTPATAEVFIIGLVLGLVRKRANTTVCVVIHALYNISGALIGF